MEPDGTHEAADDAAAIAANLAAVRERIASAAQRAGRRPEEVTLVAVTKTVPPERIAHAIAAGARDLAENYYQEAREKLPRFGSDVRWHFIGHLQTNKARSVAGQFALVQSVDSVTLAAELGRRAAKLGICQAVLLEVKLDPAATKFGVEPDAAVELSGQVAEIEGIDFSGLMGMAPFADDPEQARPHFARLRRLFELLPPDRRRVLSMGMTGDFEVAVEEGSTMVRIGTAIFGRRAHT